MNNIVVKALNREAELEETELLKQYYINDFPVNRAEFLWQLGGLTEVDVKELKAGKDILRKGFTFRVENWDML